MCGQSEPIHRNPKLTEQRSLILSILVTVAIMTIEVIGGILSNSLALLSDAWHMLTDTLALMTCFVAGSIAMKPPTTSKSFGYHRIEIVSALTNGITLVLVSFYIFYQAIDRIIKPVQVHSVEMLAVAVFGLTANVVSLTLLSRSTMGLNVKAAFLHVFGDALGSLGVIVAAVIIFFSGFHLVDPIVSIVIGVTIIISTSGMLREVLHILLEGTPRKIDAVEVLRSIGSVDGVADAHDLHIWSITTYQIYLIVHIVLRKEDTHRGDKILNSIKKKLADRYGINHTTIQVETEQYNEIGEVHRTF
jgi:cobalt-zinc-cadmium efflux system protein